MILIRKIKNKGYFRLGKIILNLRLIDNFGYARFYLDRYIKLYFKNLCLWYMSKYFRDFCFQVNVKKLDIFVECARISVLGEYKKKLNLFLSIDPVQSMKNEK